jgi:hypothetical protein
VIGTAAVGYFMRLKNHLSESANLPNVESKLFDVLPAGYGLANGGPGGWREFDATAVGERFGVI